MELLERVKEVPLNVTADCSMDSVLKVGGAYLAMSWLFLREAFMHPDHNLLFVFSDFGLVVQIAFLCVIFTLRRARSKVVSVYADQLPVGYEDVVKRILDVFLCVILLNGSIFAMLFLSSYLPWLHLPSLHLQ